MEIEVEYIVLSLSFPSLVNKYQCIISFSFDLHLLNINYKQIEIDE